MGVKKFRVKNFCVKNKSLKFCVKNKSLKFLGWKMKVKNLGLKQFRVEKFKSLKI